MTVDAHGLQTIPARMAWRADRTPLSAAFQHQTTDGTWQPVSWRDFAAQAATLARGLAASGLGRGDVLALIAPVSLQWELLHHAALSIGVVVAGMDAHDLPERIAAMAELADVTAFAVVDPKVVAGVQPARLANARLRLVLKPPAAAAGSSPWTDCTQLSELGATLASVPPAPAAEELATIVFTSGTTGAPKGIGYTHAQLCAAVDAICDAFSFTGPDSRLLCWLPLSNLFQRVVNLGAIRQGAVTYLLHDPRKVMDVVGGVSPDIFIGVPRFYEKLHAGIVDSVARRAKWQQQLVAWAWDTGRRRQRCAAANGSVPLRLRLACAVADRLVLRGVRRVMGDRLRCMVTGSAPMPRRLLDEFRALGWLILEAYGLSENVIPMAMNRLDAHRFGTVGRPVPGNDIQLDTDGTVKVRGPGVFHGYIGDSSNAVFDSSGYYGTGDLGSFDADGFLSLTGRSSEMIKTSTGRRIAPLAIEARLASAAGIDQVLVLGNGRKCLVALCTKADSGHASQAQTRQALTQQFQKLGEHDRPLGIAVLERPFSIEAGELTSNLKLRRAMIETLHASTIEALYMSVEQAGGTMHDAPVVLWL